VPLISIVERLPADDFAIFCLDKVESAERQSLIASAPVDNDGQMGGHHGNRDNLSLPAPTKVPRAHWLRAIFDGGLLDDGGRAAPTIALTSYATNCRYRMTAKSCDPFATTSGNIALCAKRTTGVDVDRTHSKSRGWRFAVGGTCCSPMRRRRPKLTNRHKRCMWHVSPNHPISASSARVADICCALSSVDRCKDRLQQRAGIGGRARVAPETGQRRARSVAARSSRSRASCSRAISMAFRKQVSARSRSSAASAIRPSTRCKSASQKRPPDCSTKVKARLQAES
jgi:hypothetical protein